MPTAPLYGPAKGIPVEPYTAQCRLTGNMDGWTLFSIGMAVLDTLAHVATGLGVVVIAIKMLRA